MVAKSKTFDFDISVKGMQHKCMFDIKVPHLDGVWF